MSETVSFVLFGVSVACLLAGLILFWLSQRTPPEPVRTPAPPPMKQRELRLALAVGEDHPVWCAVRQCLEVLDAECVGEVIDVDRQSHPHLMHYYAGGSAHLRRLRAFLETEREAGLRNAEGDDD